MTTIIILKKQKTKTKKTTTMTAINNDHQLSRQAVMHTVTSTSGLVVRSRHGHLSSDPKRTV